MISKVAKKRRDGRSSFKTLKSYIADRLRASSYETPSSPLLQDDGSIRQMLDSGVNVEHNGIDYSTLNAEFESVLAQRPDIDDPLYHFIISWSEEDEPTDDVVFESAKDALNVLGFEDHQYISAIHKDTDNIHVHVAVNRINPETLSVVNPSNDYYKLGDLMGRIENKYGFKKTPQNKKNSKKIDLDHHGDISAKKWFSKNLKSDLLLFVKNNAPSWNELHEFLSGHGVEVNKSGGGIVFVVKGDNKKDIAIKASSIDRSLSLSALEKKLGKYEHAIFSGEKGRYERERESYDRNNTPKVVERNLKKRYKDYWESCLKDFKDIREGYNESVSAVSLNSSKEIKELYKKYPKSLYRDELIDALRWERDRKIHGKRIQVMKKISQLRKNNMLSWRDWVVEQAKQNDPDASVMLYSWNYNRHKVKAGGNYIENVTDQMATVPVGYEVVLNWKKEKRRDGVIVFYDSNNNKKISQHKNGLKVEDNDNKTIDSAVFLAVKIYKNRLRITGDAKFKQDVLDAVLRYEKFSKEKITLENEEMNHRLNSMRENDFQATERSRRPRA